MKLRSHLGSSKNGKIVLKVNPFMQFFFPLLLAYWELPAPFESL